MTTYGYALLLNFILICPTHALLAWCARNSAVHVSTSLLWPKHPTLKAPLHSRRRLHMHAESIAAVVLAGASDMAIGSVGDRAADTITSVEHVGIAATDLSAGASNAAGSAKAFVDCSLESVSNFVGSIATSISSVEDEVGHLSSYIVAPFQQLGEDSSSWLSGNLNGIQTGVQQTLTGAQTKFSTALDDTFVHPFQDVIGEVLARFGASPEQLMKEGQELTDDVEQSVRSAERIAPPSTIFYAENAAVLPLWLSMIVWPEKPVTKMIMSTYGPIVVAALLYVWLTYECFQNPSSLEGFASGIANLGALTKGFGEEVSVVTAWSHFLAEDLFIGRWVYLDGRKNGIYTRHSLVLCYLFGPAGILSHLATRAAFSIVRPGVRDVLDAGHKPLEAVTREDKTRNIIASAEREAASLVAQAKRDGEAKATSILEAAEVEALDILKGAEVERSALLRNAKLKAERTESLNEVPSEKTGPIYSVEDRESNSSSPT